MQLQIEKEKALKAFQETDANGKKLLSNLFGNDVIPGNIMDRVKDFDDILAINGISMSDFVRAGETPDELAYRQIKLVAEVYNEGVVLDANNTSQYKYYPWHEITPGSGFGLSYDDYDTWRPGSGVGVRLCFKSKELAIDAGKKFLAIYAQLKIK